MRCIDSFIEYPFTPKKALEILQAGPSQFTVLNTLGNVFDLACEALGRTRQDIYNVINPTTIQVARLESQNSGDITNVNLEPGDLLLVIQGVGENSSSEPNVVNYVPSNFKNHPVPSLNNDAQHLLVNTQNIQTLLRNGAIQRTGGNIVGSENLPKALDWHGLIRELNRAQRIKPKDEEFMNECLYDETVTFEFLTRSGIRIFAAGYDIKKRIDVPQDVKITVQLTFKKQWEKADVADMPIGAKYIAYFPSETGTVTIHKRGEQPQEIPNVLLSSINARQIDVIIGEEKKDCRLYLSTLS